MSEAQIPVLNRQTSSCTVFHTCETRELHGFRRRLLLLSITDLLLIPSSDVLIITGSIAPLGSLIPMLDEVQPPHRARWRSTHSETH